MGKNKRNFKPRFGDLYRTAGEKLVVVMNCFVRCGFSITQSGPQAAKRRRNIKRTLFTIWEFLDENNNVPYCFDDKQVTS